MTPEFTAQDRINALKEAANINKLILKRNLKKKLSRYPILGRLGAEILYSDFLYPIIKSSYRKKSVRRFIGFILKTFRLKVSHF